jgi:hypothetical protein
MRRHNGSPVKVCRCYHCRVVRRHGNAHWYVRSHWRAFRRETKMCLAKNKEPPVTRGAGYFA